MTPIIVVPTVLRVNKTIRHKNDLMVLGEPSTKETSEVP